MAEESEKTCENCEYEYEDMEGTHCRHCIHNAEEHFAPKINHEKEIRAKAIDEVMEIVKKAYHNFSGYDLEFMTKYGNKNESQQAESYSTLMMYEIAGEFDDLLDSLEQLKGGAE